MAISSSSITPSYPHSSYARFLAVHHTLLECPVSRPLYLHFPLPLLFLLDICLVCSLTSSVSTLYLCCDWSPGFWLGIWPSEVKCKFVNPIAHVYELVTKVMGCKRKVGMKFWGSILICSGFHFSSPFSSSSEIGCYACSLVAILYHEAILRVAYSQYSNKINLTEPNSGL
jgi:hypothetical protein